MSRKWLFILPWEPNYPGGVNHVVLNLINTLKTSKTLKPALLIDKESGTFQFNDDTPVNYLLLSNPCWTIDSLRIAIYLIKLPLLLYKLSRLIGSDVACINPHYPSLNVINYIFLKKLRLYNGKIILSFHGSDLLTLKKTVGIERSLWNYVFKNVDFMVCCSNRLSEELSECINDTHLEKRIISIHNGINTEQLKTTTFENPKLSSLKSQKSKIILNVASFEHKKGQDILIKAFSKIKSNFKNINLILIGFVSDQLEYCKNLSRELNCENDIIFIKNLDYQSVLGYFKEADVFCLPSRYEPFGLVLLEAGFFSRPVVASNVGGIPEIIEHGTDGYLVPPDNVDELAAALEKLLNDSELATQMGHKFHEKVINNFTWNIACMKYLDLLS